MSLIFRESTFRGCTVCTKVRPTFPEIDPVPPTLLSLKCTPCLLSLPPPSSLCTWQCCVQKGLRSSRGGKEMCLLFFFSFFPWCENRFKCKVNTGGGVSINICLMASQKAIFTSLLEPAWYEHSGKVGEVQILMVISKIEGRCYPIL